MVSHLRIGRYPRPSVQDDDVIGLWRSHFRDVVTSTLATITSPPQPPPPPGPHVVFAAAATNNNTLIVAQVGSDVVLDCMVATRNLKDHEPVRC